MSKTSLHNLSLQEYKTGPIRCGRLRKANVQIRHHKKNARLKIELYVENDDRIASITFSKIIHVYQKTIICESPFFPGVWFTKGACILRLRSPNSHQRLIILCHGVKNSSRRALLLKQVVQSLFF